MLREGSKNAISISEKGLFDCKKICINMLFKIWRDGTKKGYVKLYNLIK